ncbi:MAG: PHP domain-containing protein [Candidatus Sungbacteria bacterium]|nr:PHP domain-containing protein [Candidatus Sungbacteria bacterium]
MNTFDLQIQSTASDGKHTPAEIVRMAAERGVVTIAMTDHDTVAGVAEAVAAGGESGVRVIPGIEMSVEEHGLHILGYGIDCANEKLLHSLEESKQGRIAGAQQMVKNLQQAGFVVTWDDVQKQATGAVVARPHLARAVIAHPENNVKLGGISTVHDFIEAFLTDDSPNYVRRTHISAADAIGLIRDAGGVAIWSHPAIHFRNDPDGLEHMLQKLIEWGIKGMEVFNPSHTEDDVEYLEGLVAKYNLLRTAGSDFHEARPSQRDSGSTALLSMRVEALESTTSQGLHAAEFIGDYETYGFSTEGIIELLDKAIG